MSIPEVVGHDDNTTSKVLDCLGKGVDCRNIETVGRLVKQQHIGRVESEKSEYDTALLSFGQSTHQGSLYWAGAAVAAELRSPELVVLRLLTVSVTDKVEGAHGQIKLLGAVLRVEAELEMGVLANGTASRRDLAGHETQ